ncbi:MAG: hypothetical protein ACI9T7_003922 [Oleiphilaceae bacterium]|jgi:hypothetical protein
MKQFTNIFLPTNRQVVIYIRIYGTETKRIVNGMAQLITEAKTEYRIELILTKGQKRPTIGHVLAAGKAIPSLVQIIKGR